MPLRDPNRHDTALICASGHVLSRHLEEVAEPAERCSAAISKCLNCGDRIRGDKPNFRVLARIAPPSHCAKCGTPYPWRMAELEQAEKTLQLKLETEDWDAATKTRLQELYGEIAVNKASTDYLVASAKWLEQRSGSAARNALWEIVKAIAAEGVVSAVRAGLGIP